MTKSQFNLLKKLIYCNKLNPGDINETNAIEMIKIAHEYKIYQLRLYCEEAIVEKSDFWDRYDLLEIAKRYESQYLELWIIYQFQINYEDIKNDTRYKNMEVSLKQKIYMQAWPGDEYFIRLKKFHSNQPNKKKDPTKCIMM